MYRKTSIKTSKSTSKLELLNPARQEVIDRIMTALESDIVPWRKEWKSSVFSAPHNFTNGKPYQGNNLFILSIMSLLNGFDDPRWMTFKQIADKNYQLRKGSKGTKIEYWYVWDKEQNRKMDLKEYNDIIRKEPERKDDFRLCTRCYVVFNGNQIDGIPPHTTNIEAEKDYNVHDALSSIIEGIGVGFKHMGDVAYYMPSLDQVVMPPLQSFETEMAYHATALHELAHSTMHESRLDRKEARESGGMRSEQYAIEELRAEFASMFLTQELGFDILGNTLDNHASYIHHWKSMIKTNPNVLFDAIKDANEISGYLYNHTGLSKNSEMELHEDQHEMVL